MARPNKTPKLTTPSYFWEDFLKESISENDEDVKRFQSTADSARTLLENTNTKIMDIRSDPTALPERKAVQIEKLVKRQKRRFENLLNDSTSSLSSSIAKINNEIQQEITNADRIMAKETRERLASMNDNQKRAFIEQLRRSGDTESLAHLLQRSPAFLGIEADHYSEIKRDYINTKFPEKSKRLDTLKKIENNLRKGFFAVVDDFDNFKTAATKKAEAAEAAMTE